MAITIHNEQLIAALQSLAETRKQTIEQVLLELLEKPSKTNIQKNHTAQLREQFSDWTSPDPITTDNDIDEEALWRELEDMPEISPPVSQTIIEDRNDRI